MFRLIIADGFCPRPYSDRSLRNEALGGTESAVILLAETLAEQVEVTVLQHCRREEHVSPRGVRYLGAPDWRVTASIADPSSVIVINSPKLLGIWARACRHADLFLWRHNFLGNRHRAIADTLELYDATMVCVSRFQLEHALEHTQSVNPERAVSAASLRDRATVIPNPVEVYQQAATEYDRDRLIFCSSPHKGLSQVIRWFERAKLAIPSLTLTVANPGYMADQIIHRRGVTVVGALPRAELHRIIAQSLCLFYPQTSFVETFCLVAAEANALGTPVLAPAIGALPDVTAPSDQLLRDLDESTVIDCLGRWRADERPATRLRPEYSPANVARCWHDLFDPADKPSATVIANAEYRVPSAEALLSPA